MRSKNPMEKESNRTIVFSFLHPLESESAPAHLDYSHKKKNNDNNKNQLPDLALMI